MVLNNVSQLKHIQLIYEGENFASM